MTWEQAYLYALLAAVLSLLVWGRFRYDGVAFGALVAASVAGVVPADRVFSGFGHPATIIVALVLILSRGLSNSGAVSLLTRRVASASRPLGGHIAVMGTIAAGLSAVVNNVAALAVLMPADIQAAAKAKRSPALSLMPLSFASILGGMVTLIGTPSNVVIAAFRERALGSPFTMFDFTPVGAVVAVAGLVFIVVVGWRLIPAARAQRDVPKELRDLEGYVAEVLVPAGCPAVGATLGTLEPLADEHDVCILGLVRGGSRLPAFAERVALLPKDTIVLEGGPEAIEQFVGAAGLEYAGVKQGGWTSEALVLTEAVVPAGALVEGRSGVELRLPGRYGVRLLGVSRRGRRFRDRVRHLPVQAGDILLLLGTQEAVDEAVPALGCLPLAERGLSVAQRHKAHLAVLAFCAAIVAASLGWVHLPIALAAVVLAYIALRIVPAAQVYRSVEWPVIVLLGSLIPIAEALQETGATSQIAEAVLTATAGLPPAAVLAILMVVTMTLSDVLNNVATALVAAPIGVELARQLDANPDAFLMGVAVSAACAFLTPIGHKNNSIILGPGGYRFGDYWRMGLPLEAVVLLVGFPMILLCWPL